MSQITLEQRGSLSCKKTLVITYHISELLVGSANHTTTVATYGVQGIISTPKKRCRDEIVELNIDVVLVSTNKPFPADAKFSAFPNYLLSSGALNPKQSAERGRERENANWFSDLV